MSLVTTSLCGCGKDIEGGTGKIDKNSSCITIRNTGEYKFLIKDLPDVDERTELIAPNLGHFAGPHSYTYLESSAQQGFEGINVIGSNYNIGQDPNQEENARRFIKYSFRLYNQGEAHDYDFIVKSNIKYKAPKGGGYALDEYLRVVLLVDNVSKRSERITYAKRSLNAYEKTGEIYKEDICGKEGAFNDRGKAELFVNDDTYISTVRSIGANTTDMMSLVFYLEGEDNECAMLEEHTIIDVDVEIKAH